MFMQHQSGAELVQDDDGGAELVQDDDSVYKPCKWSGWDDNWSHLGNGCYPWDASYFPRSV